MHLPKPETETFKPCPAGVHAAICYRFIDLGTQRFHHPGQAIDQRKVLISWELPGLVLMEGEHAGAPYTFHQHYTWSMHEKATLRRHLESWRGVPFREHDFGEGGCDMRDLLGKACMLTLVQTGRAGRQTVKLQTITRLPKSRHVPDTPSNPITYFSLEADRFDYLAFKALSDRLQATIRRTPEFQARMRLPPSIRGANEAHGWAAGAPRMPGSSGRRKTACLPPPPGAGLYPPVRGKPS